MFLCKSLRPCHALHFSTLETNHGKDLTGFQRYDLGAFKVIGFQGFFKGMMGIFQKLNLLKQMADFSLSQRRNCVLHLSRGLSSHCTPETSKALFVALLQILGVFALYFSQAQKRRKRIPFLLQPVLLNPPTLLLPVPMLVTEHLPHLLSDSSGAGCLYFLFHVKENEGT